MGKGNQFANQLLICNYKICESGFRNLTQTLLLYFNDIYNYIKKKGENNCKNEENFCSPLTHTHTPKNTFLGGRQGQKQKFDECGTQIVEDLSTAIST